MVNFVGDNEGEYGDSSFGIDYRGGFAEALLFRQEW